MKIFKSNAVAVGQKKETNGTTVCAIYIRQSDSAVCSACEKDQGFKSALDKI